MAQNIINGRLTAGLWPQMSWRDLAALCKIKVVALIVFTAVVGTRLVYDVLIARSAPWASG